MAARRLLVVDDSQTLRTAVRRLLADLPAWEICGEAINGNEAIEKAVALQPDVILMDVAMPELDGLEATRRITQRMHVPVLMFTQFDSPQAGREAIAAGANGYLPKSHAGELIQALEAVVQHQDFSGDESSAASASGC